MDSFKEHWEIERDECEPL